MSFRDEQLAIAREKVDRSQAAMAQCRSLQERALFAAARALLHARVAAAFCNCIEASIAAEETHGPPQ